MKVWVAVVEQSYANHFYVEGVYDDQVEAELIGQKTDVRLEEFELRDPGIFDALRQAVYERCQKDGGYWPSDKIFGRLVEELGELARARRDAAGLPAHHPRETHEEEEVLDLIFTAMAYADERGFELEKKFQAILSRENQ